MGRKTLRGVQRHRQREMARALTIAKKKNKEASKRYMRVEKKLTKERATLQKLPLKPAPVKLKGALRPVRRFHLHKQSKKKQKKLDKHNVALKKVLAKAKRKAAKKVKKVMSGISKGKAALKKAKGKVLKKVANKTKKQIKEMHTARKKARAELRKKAKQKIAKGKMALKVLKKVDKKAMKKAKSRMKEVLSAQHHAVKYLEKRANKDLKKEKSAALRSKLSKDLNKAKGLIRRVTHVKTIENIEKGSQGKMKKAEKKMEKRKDAMKPSSAIADTIKAREKKTAQKNKVRAKRARFVKHELKIMRPTIRKRMKPIIQKMANTMRGKKISKARKEIIRAKIKKEAHKLQTKVRQARYKVRRGKQVEKMYFLNDQKDLRHMAKHLQRKRKRIWTKEGLANQKHDAW